LLDRQVADRLWQAVFALLNDSWEMFSMVERPGSFPAISPQRIVMHDLCALAIGVGGITLLLFSNVGLTQNDDSANKDLVGALHGSHARYSRKNMVQVSLWLTVAVV
jgi:hypothetical protein